METIKPMSKNKCNLCNEIALIKETRYSNTTGLTEYYLCQSHAYQSHFNSELLPGDLWSYYVLIYLCGNGRIYRNLCRSIYWNMRKYGA
jgi:hypothetical protein